jgi:hypothetical protein
MLHCVIRPVGPPGRWAEAGWCTTATMSDLWDLRVKAFLTKTGDEFRRFSHDVQEDARKLLSEVRDPERKQKLREGLVEVGTWARRTAEEVATAMEEGVKKAEEAFAKTAKPAPTAPSPPPGGESGAAAPQPKAPPEKAEKTEKTVGPPAHRKPVATSKAKGKKTIGRKGEGSSDSDD